VPALLTLATQAWVSQLERVAIFSLTPVIAAVLEPHIGLANRRSNGALPASLTAVAGALAIFPLSVPATPAASLAVLIVVIAAGCVAIGNCIAVRFATSQANSSIATSALWMCAASAITFAAASACIERTRWQFPPGAMQFVWLVAFDLPPLLLLFWLLSRMSATRMSARFVLAPLFTVLVGIALEQPQITTRMIIGVALLAVGAAWLLFANECDESAELIRLT
jgi:drug/metabolite transporter (DMT)-like permease